MVYIYIYMHYIKKQTNHKNRCKFWEAQKPAGLKDLAFQ